MGGAVSWVDVSGIDFRYFLWGKIALLCYGSYRRLLCYESGEAFTVKI